MASHTLEREVEVVVPKATPATAVVDAAKAERPAEVRASGMPATSRAWDSKAQID